MGQTKNIFSVDHKIRDLRCKTISVLIFTSNNFRLSFLTRTRSYKCSPSSVTPSSTISLTPNAQDPFFQITPSISPIYELIYEPTNRSSTQSLRPTDLRTHEPEPSTSPATQSLRATNPRTDLSLSLWFWFFVWFWSTHEPIWVFVWFWFFTFSLWSLIFLLLLWWCGWWCFGGFLVVWWWVLCGWWWKIAFSECYQTHENIF